MIVDMSRLYLIAAALVLISVPHTVNGFFLQSFTNISVSRNISCRVNDNQTLAGNFQLCVVRVYNGVINSTEVTFSVYNGLRYGNSFHRLRDRRCSLSPTESSGGGTGLSSCTPLTSVETYQQMQMCICATDNCNQNMTSCQASLRSVTGLPPAVPLTSDFFTPVPCAHKPNTSFLCTDHPFINASNCEAYVTNNSVMCAISIDGTQVTQTALVEEDYDRFLTEKIYQFKILTNYNTTGLFNETATNFYLRYMIDASRSIEECTCTSFSLCNYNKSTCVLQSLAQMQTTMSMTSVTSTTAVGNTTSITSIVSASTSGMTSALLKANATSAATSSVTNAAATSVVSTSTSGMTSALLNANTTSAATSPVTNTAATSVVSTSISGMTSALLKANATSAATSSVTNAAATSVVSTSTSGMTSALLNANATSAATSSATNMTTTSVSITSVLNTNRTTITTASAATVNITSVTTATGASVATVTTTTVTSTTTNTPKSSLTGEHGLGAAPTAGIVCGIIFSALLFIGEIAFFKFLYPRLFGGAPERSVAYHP